MNHHDPAMAHLQREADRLLKHIESERSALEKEKADWENKKASYVLEAIQNLNVTISYSGASK